MAQIIGYHLKSIPKGVVGKVSKIIEEIDELEDAMEQGVKIMALVELSDLYGAIDLYLKHNNKNIQDVDFNPKVGNISLDQMLLFKESLIGVEELSTLQIKELMEHIYGFLCSTFPSTTMEDLEKMSFVTQRAFVNGARK